MVLPRERSFQNEIPPSRINIRYVKDTGDAQEKIELPLKLLLVGDYTGREDDTLVEARERLKVDKNNFSSVLKEQKLEVEMMVPNRLTDQEGDELAVNLKIESLDDFTPDNIVDNVAELQEMVALRNLLKDLKARVITNRKFRMELDRLIAQKEGASDLEAIRAELDRIAPLPEVIKGGKVELDSGEDDDY